MPISFGIEQALIQNLANGVETEDDFRAAVRQAFVLVHEPRAVDKDLEILCSQVLRHIDKHQTSSTEKPVPKPSPVPAGKSLGSQYATWLSEQGPEEVCIILANYDLDKAADYYWRQSAEVVREAIKTMAAKDNQMLLTRFEAVMYGMGGKYSDDDGGSANVHDLNSAEGQAALKQFGF